ncbi:unnamed protein product [Lymnaea stagnalis]|uniref:Uncharacterized protein n=1 Tax=Lymnaea stagnalis TaxID=6523 RepID=A0AAV2I933_LYMST
MCLQTKCRMAKLDIINVRVRHPVHETALDNTSNMYFYLMLLTSGCALIATVEGEQCHAIVPTNAYNDIIFPEYKIKCGKEDGDIFVKPAYCETRFPSVQPCCSRSKLYECHSEKINCPGLFLYEGKVCKLSNKPYKLPKYAHCTCERCILPGGGEAGSDNCTLSVGRCVPAKLEKVTVSLVCVDLETKEATCIHAKVCLPQSCECSTY